jgi:hypothetical protein
VFPAVAGWTLCIPPPGAEAGAGIFDSATLPQLSETFNAYT